MLTGFMGAGKSAVGARLAREIGWVFVDLDDEIVRASRKTIAEIFESDGEARFRELENRTLTAVLRQSDIVLALGGGAIETAGNRRLLAEDPETLAIYLEAPMDILMQRCANQRQTEADAPLRPVLERRAELNDRFLRRRPLYESAHWTVATANLSLDEVVEQIVVRWKSSIHARARRQ